MMERTASPPEPTINCKVTLENGTIGKVKFVGEIQGKPGFFYGVEVSRGKALNSGNVGTVSYFPCRPGKGVFVRRPKVSAFKPFDAAHPVWPITYGTRLLIPDRGIGEVKYIGFPDFAKNSDPYYGIELEGGGKNNGTVRNKFYFETDPGRGVFVPSAKIATFQFAPMDGDINIEQEDEPPVPVNDSNDGENNDATESKELEETSPEEAVVEASEATVEATVEATLEATAEATTEETAVVENEETATPETKSLYILMSDDDDEIAPPRTAADVTAEEKQLKDILNRLQQKSGAAILSRAVRDFYSLDDDEKDVEEDDGSGTNEVPPSDSDVTESEAELTPAPPIDLTQVVPAPVPGTETAPIAVEDLPPAPKAPKKKAKKKKKKARRQQRARPTNGPWAAGTGYGCSFDNTRWDMREWDVQQTALYGELREIVEQISNSFRTIPPEINTRRMIRRSCLIMFLCDQLATSSMAAMNKHHAFFLSVFTLLDALAEFRLELHSLCTKTIRLPGDIKVNLWKYMEALYKQATQAASLSSSQLDANEDNEDIFPQIIATVENMRGRFQESGKLVQIEEVKDGEDDKSYVEHMEDSRFDTVESFAAHNFSGNASGASARKLIRRLGNEFADLAVSLPLNEESSIFLRVSETRMDLVKFLVVPADDTPYAGGCFIFDAYFPSSYPNEPPKVNLMTTGGGTVRFNPNLYESGYVCLSLLGTWEGQSQGERWQSNISTFLQVVLSVQCLIFVPQPYYNEPGFEAMGGQESASEAYSKDKQLNTVRWAMIDLLVNPPPEFKKTILRHFYLSRNRCIKNATNWLGANHELVTKLRGLLEQLDESVFTDEPRVPTA